MLVAYSHHIRTVLGGSSANWKLGAEPFCADAATGTSDRVAGNCAIRPEPLCSLAARQIELYASRTYADATASPVAKTFSPNASTSNLMTNGCHATTLRQNIPVIRQHPEQPKRLGS